METFLQICHAVRYAALKNFSRCERPEEEVKRPEVKKAMRYSVQIRLYEHIKNQK